MATKKLVLGGRGNLNELSYNDTDFVIIGGELNLKSSPAPIIGEIIDYPSTSLLNFLPCDGKTIGNVGSGADYQNADYLNLFNIIKLKTEYGNTGLEDFTLGDVVKLPNFIYESGFLTLSVNQSINLSIGNHIEFDTKNIGSNLLLSTGVGQANGLITLNPYKTYKGYSSIVTNYSAATGLFVTQLFNHTLGSQLQNSNQVVTRPITDGSLAANNENNSFFYNPNSSLQIKIQILASTNVSIITKLETFFFIETVGISKENTFIRYQ